jgi:primosomal replication protein N
VTLSNEPKRDRARERSEQSSLTNGSSVGVVVGFLAKHTNTLLLHIYLLVGN